MTFNTISQGIDLRKEALITLAYFALYLGYLFINPENEWMHWLTLVAIPLLSLSFWHVKRLGLSFSSTLASFGLRKGNLKNGISWAIVLGLAISCLQLLISRQGDEMWELLRSGRAILYFPLALLLQLLTAGFTEEFFFRGVMQTRLVALLRSKFWAIIVSSLLFGIYHLPYAYLNPNWPSSGDWNAAVESALSLGIPAGIVLGVLYAAKTIYCPASCCIRLSTYCQR